MSSILLFKEAVMIYLDNGATSFPKPKGMLQAMEECMTKYCGNPGRSGHVMSMKTGEKVYQARRQVAEFLGIDDGERLLFTKNATEALNLGIKGVLREGDGVITTSMEHNSVLRPLRELEKKGVKTFIVEGRKDGFVSPQEIERKIKPNTRLIVITAASNVTGTKMPIKEIGEIASKRRILFLVDGAQGAGSMKLDIGKMNIDMFAFPGHKGLLGPLGTGGLYVRKGIALEPLLTGGTGTESKSRVHPREFPEGYEAGTINAPAIIGLGKSVEYLNKIGVDVIEKYEREIIEYLDNCLDEMDFITKYGPDAKGKTGMTLFNFDGITAEELTAKLSGEYGIAVRGGYHCAGLAHRTIGTWNTGGVRVSVSPFTSKLQVDALVEALWDMGKKGQKNFFKPI